jgi:hypothetical protein
MMFGHICGVIRNIQFKRLTCNSLEVPMFIQLLTEFGNLNVK